MQQILPLHAAGTSTAQTQIYLKKTISNQIEIAFCNKSI